MSPTINVFSLNSFLHLEIHLIIPSKASKATTEVEITMGNYHPLSLPPVQYMLPFLPVISIIIAIYHFTRILTLPFSDA